MRSLALILIAAIPAVAQNLPTADQLIDKYVNALGGKAAIQKLTSRVSKGTFDLPAFSVTGQYTGYAKAPNQMAHYTEVEGYGTVIQCYDGQTAWSSDPERGLTDLKGNPLARMARGAVFHSELKFKELYETLAVTGKEKVNERDAYVVEATAKAGGNDKMYFDAENGLIVRVDSETESPDGAKFTATTYLDDYREVDGIKVPFGLRQESPQFSFSIKMKEITHNVPIEDAKFQKPKQ